MDIELPTTACVLIVTDLSFATHTVIDPTTEAVQIVGRFRNGVEDAAHIFSTNKEMPCKSREEIAMRLEECEAVYKQVLQIEASGAGCDTRAQALEGMDYKRFMNADGTRNWFMWDNAYDDRADQAALHRRRTGAGGVRESISHGLRRTYLSVVGLRPTATHKSPTENERAVPRNRAAVGDTGTKPNVE